MSHVHELLGKQITWSVPQPAQFDPGSWRSIPQPDLVRTGVVWSHGPVENTAWVIPDERAEGEGHAVCVLIPRSGAYTQRDVDRTRSGVKLHRLALDHLRFGTRLPAVLGRGGDGYGLLPNQLPRGNGEDPIESYAAPGITGAAYRRGAAKPKGTCPECGRRQPVKRAESYAVRNGRTTTALLSVAPAIAPHKVQGAPCSGVGRPPAETRYTPGQELAKWIATHGKEAVA